jgi:hypothetical protein
MMRSRTVQVTREPLDRRRMRLIQMMLAFPAAGIIGFAGSALVRSVVAEDTSIASPATPGRTTDESPASREHDEPEPSDNSNTVRRV